MKEGMDDPRYIPDHLISTNPKDITSSNSPTNVRPSATEPWSPPVDQNPELIVDVTPVDTTGPTPVESVEVSGNVATVTVLVRETPTGPFVVKKDNVPAGIVTFKPPVNAYEIKIVPKTPADPSTPTYDMKVKIKACFETMGKC